jgi:hypothetical protein
VHPHCYLLRLPEKEGMDLSGAKSYMTKGYIELVWKKLKMQQRVLDLGYDLLFTARRTLTPPIQSLYAFFPVYKILLVLSHRPLSKKKVPSSQVGTEYLAPHWTDS